MARIVSFINYKGGVGKNNHSGRNGCDARQTIWI